MINDIDLFLKGQTIPDIPYRKKIMVFCSNKYQEKIIYDSKKWWKLHWKYKTHKILTLLCKIIILFYFLLISGDSSSFP